MIILKGQVPHTHTHTHTHAHAHTRTHTHTHFTKHVKGKEKANIKRKATKESQVF